MPDLGNIDFRLNVMDKYANLREDSARADVVLVIQGEKFKVHRFILSIHSKFFRVLFFVQEFKEANENEVKLNAPLVAFKFLLDYMYTGTIDLRKCDISDVADLLELTHRYEMLELENAITEYLCYAIDAKNACRVIEIAYLLDKRDLAEQCRQLISMIVEGIYKEDLDLSFETFKIILDGREYSQSEIKWFQILQKLLTKVSFCTDQEKEELLEMIDLERMTLNQLIEIVQPSGLFKDTDLFETIRSQSLLKSKPLYNRSSILKNAEVIADKNCKLVLKSGKQSAYSTVNANSQNGYIKCIKVNLRGMYYLNHLEFDIKQVDDYRYYIEASKDERAWNTIVAFVSGRCKNHQNVYFPELVAQFIRINIISTKVTTFDCINFDVSHVPFPPTSVGDLIYPNKNVASPGKAVVFLKNYETCTQHLLNDYLISSVQLESCSFYESAKIGKENLSIEFNQPFLLSSCRFKLWEQNDYKCSYKVTTTFNFRDFDTVSNKSDELLNGWQLIKFSPRPVSAICIEGTRATDGNEIRVTRFEAPAIE